ncbi:MAG: ABC-type multidrug transport system, ATPase component CcmA [Candidatus Methanohalarchaeum thermophilum]|uniref:ABC-type multidrug transport system, ATPase component CcmA n=1 Tax=Methanohalarchaeum thermophilum TaxID=1903181 RepID=A0A1Q6DSF3_METT1|nr:MAG: ABC-type multidrug transport system, ATPase component CcmA [Candidatus Methanohalarchaeum thermophilum]
MKNAIETRGLTKSYDGIEALREVDLSVGSGEVFGFLGPNGAGKTTTIRILLDFIRPDSGEAEVLGLDAQENSLDIRKNIGYLPEVSNVYSRLTGFKHLKFAKETKNADTDISKVLERVGLFHDADKRAGTYSKGMKQRLCLGIALVGEPELFILDEPTTGLDPNGARMVREIVKEEKDRGATVFFSSHILEQVEKVSDRVGILKDGKIVAEDTIEGLRERTGRSSYMRIEVNEVPDLRELEGMEGVKSVEVEDNVIEIEAGRDVVRSEIFEVIERENTRIIDLRTKESSLDDIFAILTEK